MTIVQKYFAAHFKHNYKAIAKLMKVQINFYLCCI